MCNSIHRLFFELGQTSASVQKTAKQVVSSSSYLSFISWRLSLVLFFHRMALFSRLSSVLSHPLNVSGQPYLRGKGCDVHIYVSTRAVVRQKSFIFDSDLQVRKNSTENKTTNPIPWSVALPYLDLASSDRSYLVMVPLTRRWLAGLASGLLFVFLSACSV